MARRPAGRGRLPQRMPPVRRRDCIDRRNLQQDLHAGLQRFFLVSRTITEQRGLGAGDAVPGPELCRSSGRTGLRSSSRPPEHRGWMYRGRGVCSLRPRCSRRSICRSIAGTSSSSAAMRAVCVCVCLYACYRFIYLWVPGARLR